MKKIDELDQKQTPEEIDLEKKIEAAKRALEIIRSMKTSIGKYPDRIKNENK